MVFLAMYGNCNITNSSLETLEDVDALYLDSQTQYSTDSWRLPKFKNLNYTLDFQ